MKPDVCLHGVQQDVEFTLGEESEKSKKEELSPAELTKQLDRLIQDKVDNQRIFDWIEVCIVLLTSSFLFGSIHHLYFLQA